MGKVIALMSISVDGFIESPDRDISWHMVDAALHQYMNDLIAPMSTVISGRTTYELMADYWPTADEDPDATPVEAEFAKIWRDKPKIVYSRTLEQAGWNTRIVRELDPADIRRLKESSDEAIGVGGAELIDAFRAQGLIDEWHLLVHPVAIGRGKPLFTPGDWRLRLRLAETRTFDNGVVLLRYETQPENT